MFHIQSQRINIENYDINPFSPFNPICTEEESEKNKPVTRQALKLTQDVEFKVS